MKRNSIFILVCALFSTMILVSTFAGCAMKTTVVDSGKTQFEQMTSGEKVELKMLIPNTSEYTPGAATKDGYYYIQPMANNILAGQIRYIDYASGKDTPLSTQINGENTSNEDFSYVDSIIGQYCMFCWNDKIYVMRSGASWYVDNSDFGSLAASAIYQMELDGSNRKQIYLGDNSTELLMFAAGTQNSLYLFRQRINIIEVFCISEGGGEETLIAEFPCEVPVKLVGCYGEKMYFSRYSYNKSYSTSINQEQNTETLADSDAINNESIQLSETLTVLNVANGEIKDIMNLSDSDAAQPFISNENLYLYYPSSLEVDICDLNGAVSKSVFFESQMKNMDLYIGRGPTLIENTLFVPCWDNEADIGANLVIDLEAGTVNRSNAIINRTDGRDIPPAQVVAETENEYLVITGYTICSAKMPMGDSTTNTTEMLLLKYSIIEKTAFCSENYNGREVSRINEQDFLFSSTLF